MPRKQKFIDPLVIQATVPRALPGGCEDASLQSRETYIPCNRPAVSMIHWPKRKEGPYRMCEMCAKHSVRNRGAELAGPYTGPPMDLKEATSYLSTTQAWESLPKVTAADLVAEHLLLKDHVDSESKKFAEYCKPYATRLGEIDNQLLAMLIQQGCDSFNTEAGTAYKSTLMNVSVTADETASYVDPDSGRVSTGREAVIDFALANWDEVGNELLMVNVKKDSVKQWMEAHAGTPPPGVKVGFFTRVNVRRS